MGTHTAPVNRAGSNASDTSVAIAFSWAVGAGTGTNPVNAADFPGGTFPSGTGTIPAGSASATITFQSNPDTTFEQDETGILTLTTTQSGVTVTGSPQPFTITNDDADPGSGGGTVIYGPTTTGDTGSQDVASANQRMEHPYTNSRVAGTYMLALDANGNGVALHQQTDTVYQIRVVTAYSVGNKNDSNDSTILAGARLNINYADGDILSVELRSGNIRVFKNGAAQSFGSGTTYDVSAYVKGNFARYLKFAGTTVADLKIIRL